MTVLLLIAAALVLLTLVAVPIELDDLVRHPGATAGWSPLAEVGPSVTSHEFRTGTGWPA